MNTNNRIAEIKKRLKQGKYYVPYAPDDIEYLLSELSKTRLERNQLEANKNYYKEQLAKAEADGRLVMLPCKVGDTVFTTRWWDDVKEKCTDSKGKPFFRTIRKHKVTKEVFSPFGLDYIEWGKTVFLTREAAEKALGGAEDGK